MVLLLSLLLIIHCVLAFGLSFHRSGSILPVFRNVHTANIRDIDSIIHNRYACSLSINPGPMDSLAALCNLNSKCIIGCTSLSNDISRLSVLKRFGANFISHSYDRLVISSAKKCGLSAFSEVSSIPQCDDAIENCSDGLIIYQSSTTKQCLDILSHYRHKHPNSDIPLFISGDIQDSQFEEYLNYEDTLNFMVDFDFAKQSAEVIGNRLNSMERELNTINLKLRIQRDLKNSCL